MIAPSLEAIGSVLIDGFSQSQLQEPARLPPEAGTKSDGQAAIITMANRCRERFAADFLLVVGPFPKYDPDDATKTAPGSHVAMTGANVSRIVDYTFLGDMTLNKSRAAKIALNLLRLHLLRSDPDANRLP